MQFEPLDYSMIRIDSLFDIFVSSNQIISSFLTRNDCPYQDEFIIRDESINESKQIKSAQNEKKVLQKFYDS
jgi:hypothetical protein